MSLFRSVQRWFSWGSPQAARAWGDDFASAGAFAGHAAFPLPRFGSVTALNRVLDGPLSDAEALQALHKSPGFTAILDEDNRVVWAAGMGVVPKSATMLDALIQVRRTLAPVEFRTVIDHVTHNVLAYPWFDRERRRHTVLSGTPWFPPAWRGVEDPDDRVTSIAASACEAAALLGERPDGLCASCERRGVCWLHDRREAATTTG